MPLFRFAILAALASGVVLAAPEEPKAPTPKFKLAKDTTFVTEPLDADGYVDYEAALNKQLKGAITPETNAVVLLVKCFGPKPEGKELHPDFYKALGIKPPPAEGEYLVPRSKYFSDELKADAAKEFYATEERLSRRSWNAADAPKFAEWLKVNEKPLAVAVEASRRKDYYHPMVSRTPDGKKGMLIGALLPIVQKNREIATLLSLRATLKLGEGKIDDAFADVLTIHRLARTVAKGGTLIEGLVGIALQGIAHSGELAVLEHGKLTAKQALAYRDEVLKLAPLDKVADKIGLCERMTFLDSVQETRRGGFEKMREVEGIGSGAAATKEEIEKIAAALDWEAIFRLGNGWYDKVDVAMRKPTRAERVAAGEAVMAGLGKMKSGMNDVSALEKLLLKAFDPEKLRADVSRRIGEVYVSLLFPAFRKVADASDRSEQIHRNGVIAAGLAAHFADHKKYPDKLEDLVPKYLAKVPDDVFSGKALIYQKTDAGYLFYSVGVNGKDDGGKLLTDVPPGDDIGVRMPRK